MYNAIHHFVADSKKEWSFRRCGPVIYQTKYSYILHKDILNNSNESVILNKKFYYFLSKNKKYFY